MRITVIGGGGYVGLITVVGFATLGHEVLGVDVDASVVDRLQKGTPSIYEEGLREALVANQATGNIRFSTDLDPQALDADVVFVAVGSPMRSDGSPDLAAISSVTEQLAEGFKRETVVAVKSTVPVGTIAAMRETFQATGNAHSLADLVVNPEFLSEGSGLRDFFYPDRIVVGTSSDRAREVMRDLYAPFLQGGRGLTPEIPMARDVPLLETSVEDAQIIKYASNAFLAMRVSFINEVAAVCDQAGADVANVALGLGYDERIGQRYLEPGIGFGGPCLEKDLRALIYFASERGYRANFLESVLSRNEEQMNHVVQRAREMAGGRLEGKRIAILGLAFKSGTNDVRTSLALRIIHLLANFGATVVAHDPVAIEEAREIAPEIEYGKDPYETTAGADLVMVLTDWSEYHDLDWDRIGRGMRGKSVFDGRNVVDRKACEAAGLRYEAIGR
jgi:UDPglucose 6-dehydrogenase